MGYLLHVVGADKVYAVIVSAHPFAARPVNGHTFYAHVSQQIVGQVCAIVAWHLYLVKHRSAAFERCHLKHERPCVGAYPHIVFNIFDHAAHPCYRHCRAIFVDERCVNIHHIVFSVVSYEGRLAIVVVDKPQQVARVEHHARHHIH